MKSGIFKTYYDTKQINNNNKEMYEFKQHQCRNVQKSVFMQILKEIKLTEDAFGSHVLKNEV